MIENQSFFPYNTSRKKKKEIQHNHPRAEREGILKRKRIFFVPHAMGKEDEGCVDTQPVLFGNSVDLVNGFQLLDPENQDFIWVYLKKEICLGVKRTLSFRKLTVIETMVSTESGTLNFF